MTADGWKPTPLGLQYFKYNRHEFRVEYPVKAARPIGNKFVGQQKRWQFDRVYNENPDTEKYMTADDKEIITVAQTKINMMMANEREKENNARDAAKNILKDNKQSLFATQIQGKKENITLCHTIRLLILYGIQPDL